MPTNPEQKRAISDIAVGTRFHDPDRVARGRRDLAAANLAADIQRRLDGDIVLTLSQIDMLTGLLRQAGS